MLGQWSLEVYKVICDWVGRDKGNVREFWWGNLLENFCLEDRKADEMINLGCMLGEINCEEGECVQLT